MHMLNLWWLRFNGYFSQVSLGWPVLLELRMMEVVSGDNRRLLLTRTKLTVKSSSPTNQHLFMTGRKGAPRVFHWGRGPRPNGWNQTAGVGFLGRGTGKQPLPKRSGERCELRQSQRGSGRSPDHPKVFHYFQHSEWPLLTLQYCCGLSCSHWGGGQNAPRLSCVRPWYVVAKLQRRLWHGIGMV